MIQLPEQIQKAVQSLQQLPGVGKRTALRYVMHMLQWKKQEVEDLIHAVHGLESLEHCSACGCYGELVERLCTICRDETRLAHGSLCVVESFTDFMAIENANFFKGHYHLLGGVLNPLLGISPQHLRIDELLKRIESQQYRHLILAINPSVEGDVTCAYISELIKDKVHVERIGFGVPIGGNLEFLDPLTISVAFANRKDISAH